MTEHAKQAIRTITAEVQPTKTGFVRTLIPEIEEALAAGYNLKLSGNEFGRSVPI